MDPLHKKGLIFVLLLLLFVALPSTGAAEESSEEQVFIIERQQEKLVTFLQAHQLPVEKKYTTFSIIQTTLNEAEITLVQEAFPASTIQKNETYEQSSIDRPSFTLIRSTSNSTLPYSGSGVKVGILDSGIDVHHKNLNVRGGYCAVDIECPAKIPYDDDNGHGTHVAGVIAAKGSMQGIAPNAEIYSIKSMNGFGFGTTSSLIDGVEWAIKNRMDILNLSITTDKHDAALKRALDTAYQKGMLIVGAVGNNGLEKNNTVLYPAKYESVIGVTAVTGQLQRLRESAIGAEVELAAPGNRIVSTYPVKLDGEDGKADGYASLSGTSMAAPHVTGILALYKERFPTKSNVEIRQMLASTAKDLGTAGRDTSFGYGLVQYTEMFPGTVNVQGKAEVGKVLVTTNATGEVILESDGKKVNGQAGGWDVYGVGGQKPLLVTTTDEKGSRWTETYYVQIQQPNFKDVTNNQRFAGPIGYLSNHQQINGFDDGTFRPYSNITRAEAAVLIGRALGFSSKQRKTQFKDVAESSFASGYIQEAVEKKIISGFTDGTFRPGEQVTRAEMAILLSKAFQFKEKSTKSFQDVKSHMAAYDAISTLIASGVTEGYQDGTFRPYGKMTRADFSVFLARAQHDGFK